MHNGDNGSRSWTRPVTRRSARCVPAERTSPTSWCWWSPRDDGVMPQTVECIAHAKAAGVPIIVALNKIDLPDINEQRILTGLSQHGVLPSEWGGDVEVVRVSALNGTGLDDLLETILVTAELDEFNAPEAIPADGVCLEAFRRRRTWPVGLADRPAGDPASWRYPCCAVRRMAAFGRCTTNATRN